MRSIGPAHRDNVIPDSSGADDSSDADESGDDYHPTEEDEVGKQVDRPAATIPYDITTDFVSFKQLKDWCTEKGMTSHNLRLLIALSPKSVCRLRKTNQAINFSGKRCNQTEAMFMEMVGEHRGANACVSCQNGTGPFKHCSTVDGVAMGICGNCHYRSIGPRCDFHPGSRARALQLSNAKASGVQGTLHDPLFTPRGIVPDGENEGDMTPAPAAAVAQLLGQKRNRSITTAAALPIAKQRMTITDNVSDNANTGTAAAVPDAALPTRLSGRRTIQVPIPANMGDKEARIFARMLRAVADTIEEDTAPLF